MPSIIWQGLALAESIHRAQTDHRRVAEINPTCAGLAAANDALGSSIALSFAKLISLPALGTQRLIGTRIHSTRMSAGQGVRKHGCGSCQCSHVIRRGR